MIFLKWDFVGFMTGKKTEIGATRACHEAQQMRDYIGRREY